MADITLSVDPTAQAYDIATQQAADARAKSGQHVKGDAARIASAAPIAATTDAVGPVAGAGQARLVAHADAPLLPDPSGPVASASKTMQVVKGSEIFASGGDGVFAALESLSDSRQKDIKDAMLVKRLQGQDQVTAKTQEMKDKQSEIHGQEVSADTKLAGSITGLGATAAMSLVGARMERGMPTRELKEGASDAERKAHEAAVAKDKLDATDRQAKGAMWRNVGMNVSGTTDAAVNMLDINVGGQSKANEAAVAQKSDAIQAQVYQNNTDSASAWLDNAKDQRKSAQQAIMTHVQMRGDAANNVWK